MVDLLDALQCLGLAFIALMVWLVGDAVNRLEKKQTQPTTQPPGDKGD